MVNTIVCSRKSTSGVKMCRGCSKPNDGQNKMVCSICEDAFHPKCAGMTVAVVQCVNQLTFFNWFCNSCGERFGDRAVNAYRAEFSSPTDVETPAPPNPADIADLRELVLECKSKIEALSVSRNSEDDGADFTPVLRKRRRPRPNRLAPTARPTTPAFNRRNNLIIAGVPEPNAAVSATAHDLKVVSGLCHALEIDTDVHAKVVRLKKGDPHASHYPLIRVEFSDPEIRKALLHNSQHLRESTLYKNVYVRPDLTPAELTARKLLVAELKQRRDDGENVFICYRSNKVIPRTMAAA